MLAQRKHADVSSQAIAPPNRTIAVILSGAYRTLTDCNDTIAKHVIDANPWARFEVFAALTADPATDIERRRMEQAVQFGRACIAAVSVESNSDVSAAVRRDAPLLDSLPAGRGTARGKAANIVKMFRGIGRAWQLLEAHTAQRDRACGNESVDAALSPPLSAAALSARRIAARYDLVLRLRPDLCFCGALDLSQALQRPGHFWLPWVSSDARLAFDQLGAGSAAMMSVYASAYHATAVGDVAARRDLYPEEVMWRHLATHGDAAAAGRVARLDGFRASLARHRADGTERYDDPYGKLRQDLMHATSLGRPALAATLPEHHCGRHHHHGGGPRQRYRAATSGAWAASSSSSFKGRGDHAECAATQGPVECKRARKAARKAARSAERAAGGR